MKKMNFNFYIYRLIFSAIFIITAFTLFAEKIDTGTDSQDSFRQPYRQEIAEASKKEVSAKDIGIWYDILESALFMLIRKTELYRGNMRLLIEDSPAAKCKIYPDGTILISTGVFDYIDAELANPQNISPRRIRNFNIERENMLAAIIAVEAAGFSLKNNLNDVKAKHASAESLNKHNLRVDMFAAVLLKIAGYNVEVLYKHFERLNKIEPDVAVSKKIISLFKENYSSQARLNNILKYIEEADIIADELIYILTGLQSEDKTIEEDVRQRCLSLKNNFSESIYFKRLAALILHKSLPNNITQKLLTAFPYASSTSNEVTALMEILNSKPETFTLSNMNLKDNQKQFIENASLYKDAVNAYEEYLNIIYEPALASAYALLLFSNGDEEEKNKAIHIAEQALMLNNDSENDVAAINYASVLFLSGDDYSKSKILLEVILKNIAEKNKTNLFLRTGTIIDERLVLCNYAVMLFGIGDIKASLKIQEKLKGLISYEKEVKPISLKKIKLHDTTDELLEYWGKPSGIKYNYFLETWIYDHLNTEIIIKTQSDNRIERINILQNSTLSLFQDLRVGESKKAFEEVLGKPSFYAADCDIYFYKGNCIQILYLNNNARRISLIKINSLPAEQRSMLSSNGIIAGYNSLNFHTRRLGY